MIIIIIFIFDITFVTIIIVSSFITFCFYYNLDLRQPGATLVPRNSLPGGNEEALV